MTETSSLEFFRGILVALGSEFHMRFWREMSREILSEKKERPRKTVQEAKKEIVRKRARDGER